MSKRELIDDVVSVIGYELLGDSYFDLDIEVSLVNLDVDAFCLHMYDEFFVIEVNKKLKGDDLIRAVCHELVHVKQYFDGRLSSSPDWVWLGEDASHYEYEEQPWEIEAHALEDELIALYKESVCVI